MNEIVENWQKIKQNIAKTCEESKRKQQDVSLIAVSKTFAAEDIKPVIVAGQRLFGENRVQEASSKWPALKAEFSDICLHLIGPLQSNKAAEAVALFDVIETIDREKIAKALSAEMRKQNRHLDCFVQVNTGLEPQKAGILPQQTADFVQQCREIYGLNIIGLMCIPPVDENPGPHFALLKKLSKQANVAKLSMGMSHDYETAIAFGASYVRVGSAIFGHRDKV